MNAIDHRVVGPRIEVVEQGASRGQVLGHVAPLAPGAQDIEQAVDHLAHIDRASAPAMLGRRDSASNWILLRMKVSWKTGWKPIQPCLGLIFW